MMLSSGCIIKSGLSDQTHTVAKPVNTCDVRQKDPKLKQTPAVQNFHLVPPIQLRKPIKIGRAITFPSLGSFKRVVILELEFIFNNYTGAPPRECL